MDSDDIEEIRREANGLTMRDGPLLPVADPIPNLDDNGDVDNETHVSDQILLGPHDRIVPNLAGPPVDNRGLPLANNPVPEADAGWRRRRLPQDPQDELGRQENQRRLRERTRLMAQNQGREGPMQDLDVPHGGNAGPNLNELDAPPAPHPIVPNLHQPDRNDEGAAGPPPVQPLLDGFGMFRRNINENVQPLALHFADDAQPPAPDFADVDDAIFEAHVHQDLEDIEEMMLEQEMMAAALLAHDGFRRTSTNRDLFDLVCEDLSCIVHSGNLNRNCSTIATFCTERPRPIAFVENRTNRTPLHEAATRCACIHIIRALIETNGPILLERDSRISALDSDSNTPLHLYLIGMARRSVLAVEDVIPVLTLLIGPNDLGIPAKVNSQGNNALHLACSAPESMIPSKVIALLISVMTSGSTVTNKSGRTPLHLHCARRDASIEVARMLVEDNPEHRFVHDMSGQTPIHYAAAQGNGPLVEYLADCNHPYSTDQTNDNHRNVLHLFKEINAKTLAVVLQNGPGCVSARTTDTLMTPLHALLADARRKVSFQVVQMMVNEDPAILKLEDKIGFLPLHYACQTNRDTEIVKLLLTSETGAALTHTNDTALSLAASQNCAVETISLLITANNLAIKVANNYGFLPLHCVCRAPQPKEAIIQLLLEAFPEARLTKTRFTGELPFHLAQKGASKSALNLLAHDTISVSALDTLVADSEVGNTDLHKACDRHVSSKSIEKLAEGNPEWLLAVNNAGYTPLQLLCRNGFIDATLVRCIYNLVGITPFQKVDNDGHTPLHLAVRSGSEEAIRALIEVYPDALRAKTIQGDTPLHLACHRNGAFVGEIGKLTCEKATQHGSHISPLLVPNGAGETPISICMTHGLCYSVRREIDYSQLAVLIKILYYGTEDFEKGGVVVACLALHRQRARLDPSFIRKVVTDHPEELRIPDSEGNYPLHIEASIPVEKMSPLLDGATCGCEYQCNSRAFVLKTMLEIFPEAAKYTNKHGDSVLSLIVKNGRPWDHTFACIVRVNPAALHSIESHELMPRIISRIGRDCGVDTLYAFLRARPSILVQNP